MPCPVYIQSDPLHQVPRLPRKSHRQSCGDKATPGRTSDPLESTKHRACYANHTGDAATTKRPQGVHPTPWRTRSTAPATQITPAKLRRPSDPRAYVRPLGEHQVARLPRKSHRQSCGDQATPRRTPDPSAASKRLQGVHPTPWRAPRTAPATQVTPAKRPQGVHPTPWRAPRTAPATQITPAKLRRPSDPNGRTSDPLESTPLCACHANHTGKAAATKRPQGAHPTCHANHTGKAAATKRPEGVHPPLGEHQVPHLPGRQITPATKRPRAYIRPLGEHQVPRQPRKSHRHSCGYQATPRVYIQPLGEHQVPRLPRKSHQQSCGDQATPGRYLGEHQHRACHANHTGTAAVTKRPQGVHHHPTPWRAPSTAPATQITPAQLRPPSDPRAYIRPLGEHQAPRLPRKSHRHSCGDQAPGRMESTKYRACHANLTSKAAGTKQPQGVHPTPW